MVTLSTMVRQLSFVVLAGASVRLCCIFENVHIIYIDYHNLTHNSIYGDHILNNWENTLQ